MLMWIRNTDSTVLKKLRMLFDQFDSDILYDGEEGGGLQEFRCAGRLSPELVSRWYGARARLIALRTNVPELALELLQKVRRT
jgi:hypothetical protein